MRHILLMTAIVLMTGCAEFQALKSAVGSYGSDAADEALDVSIWGICEGSSVGAVERRFKTEEEKAARVAICRGSP
jgi:hypothetical protein